jgi:crotonobetainyl-CoA:carnitine CoA-transferase CaiB-like acyl-CoA transferase
MSEEKRLSKRQLAVIEELFTGDLDEQDVLDKYKVSRTLFDKWQSDNNFTEQFDRRIASAYRQSAMLIARYAPLAATKLIQLTDSEKPETARRACLDIISMPILQTGRKTQVSGESQPADIQQPPPFSEHTAGRLLAVLAEEKNGSHQEKVK